MVQPTINGVRFIDPILSGLSVSFKNSEFNYDKIAPLRATNFKTGQYIVEDHDYWFRRGEGLTRGVEAPYTRLGYGYHTRSYDCYEIGAEKNLPDPVVAASQLPHQLEVSDIQHLTNRMELEFEHLAVDAFFKSGVWGSDRTGVGSGSPTNSQILQWSVSNSTPIDDIDTAMRHMHSITGAWPGALFIGLGVFYHLKKNAQILRAAQSFVPGASSPVLGAGGPMTGAGPQAQELIRQALGVNELFIGDTISETKNEGQINRPDTTEAYAGTRADIWGKHALLLMRETPGLSSRAPAVFWVWDESGNVPWAIRSYRNESIRSKVNQIFTWPCPVILSPQSGYFFSGAVA